MLFAVCDDEKAMQNDLSVLLREYGTKKAVDILVDKFESGHSLLRSSRKYDVVFMDFQMDGLDGIETARKIREANDDCTIIVVSAYPEAAQDSFEVKTFRFLKKPVDKKKLFHALDDYMKSIDYDNLLVIKSKNETWKIKISDIVYAEARGKHTIVRTVKGYIEVLVHLKIIESKLPDKKFVRCQRSYVVGFEHISNHTGSEIIFDNGERAQLGRAYAKTFKEAFGNYIIRYNSRTL